MQNAHRHIGIDMYLHKGMAHVFPHPFVALDGGTERVFCPLHSRGGGVFPGLRKHPIAIHQQIFCRCGRRGEEKGKLVDLRIPPDELIIPLPRKPLGGNAVHAVVHRRGNRRMIGSKTQISVRLVVPFDADIHRFEIRPIRPFVRRQAFGKGKIERSAAF